MSPLNYFDYEFLSAFIGSCLWQGTRTGKGEYVCASVASESQPIADFIIQRTCTVIQIYYLFIWVIVCRLHCEVCYWRSLFPASVIAFMSTTKKRIEIVLWHVMFDMNISWRQHVSCAQTWFNKELFICENVILQYMSRVALTYQYRLKDPKKQVLFKGALDMCNLV